MFFSEGTQPSWIIREIPVGGGMDIFGNYTISKFLKNSIERFKIYSLIC